MARSIEGEVRHDFFGIQRELFTCPQGESVYIELRESSIIIGWRELEMFGITHEIPWVEASGLRNKSATVTSCSKGLDGKIRQSGFTSAPLCDIADATIPGDGHLEIENNRFRLKAKVK